MPLYEYQCESCGTVFEVRQKFSDEPLKVHENCGGAVHRLLSAPALQFKGSGWYITDYARSGSHTSASNGSKPKESKSDSKTESGSATSASTSEKKS